MIGVYRIKNLKNNDCYYGSSKEIEKRFKRHLNELKKDKHHNIVLQRAWNKYGEENFVFEVVENCETKVLLDVEQKYLNKNPKYNIGKMASGGDNISKNPNRAEIINKITNSMNERYNSMTEEDKKEMFSMPMEKNPNWKGGKTYVKFYCDCGNEKKENSKTCLKCRDRSGEKNPFYNKKHSKKTIKLLSDKLKGKYVGNQNKPIIINDIEYLSAGEASKVLNVPGITIRWRALSKNPKYYNYHYKGEEKKSYTKEEQKERFAEPQRNKKHNHNKPFCIDGVKYRTLKEASINLNIHIQTIKGRLNSGNFFNYYYL